jgi:predicted metalloprotease with PDZ domain
MGAESRDRDGSTVSFLATFKSMKTAISVAALALAVSFAGCAQAQQPQSQPQNRETPGAAGVRRNPRAPAAYFGVRWALNGDRPTVASVDEGSPAAAAGLAPGDVLLSVDGRDVLEGGPMFPGAAAGRRYTLRVKRGAEERDLVIAAAAPRPATR